MATRPKQVAVWYRGIPYMLDLVRCRRALVQRQVEGDLDSIESLAQAVGISRSTASRFFSGRPTSLAVTLKILAALRLTFEDVARPQVDREEAEGSAGGAGAKLAPRPGPPGGLDAAAPLPERSTREIVHAGCAGREGIDSRPDICW
jgi:transcriptional regulator with XRE-family HTH domain